MFREFREFACAAMSSTWPWHYHRRGLWQIVTSLVNDIAMPPIGLLLGESDFSNLFINLSGRPFASLADAKAAGAPTINYSVFLNTVIDFVIVTWASSCWCGFINRLSRQPEATLEAPTTRECLFCLSSIPSELRAAPSAPPLCKRHKTLSHPHDTMLTDPPQHYALE